MHSKLRDMVSAGALLGTLWAVLATSMPRSSITEGNYYVVSDCVVPTQELAVTTSAGQIVSPAITYSALGFPGNTVTLGNDVSGTINGRPRTCYHTYGSTEDRAQAWVFSCFDDGTYTCSILIKDN
ncbi:MAG: hypothetical protein AB7G93_05905 [Bdellovibrionales bacterium]